MYSKTIELLSNLKISQTLYRVYCSFKLRLVLSLGKKMQTLLIVVTKCSTRFETFEDVSYKSNVASFEILMLEAVGGRKNVDI